MLQFSCTGKGCRKGIACKGVEQFEAISWVPFGVACVTD